MKKFNAYFILFFAQLGFTAVRQQKSHKCRLQCHAKTLRMIEQKNEMRFHAEGARSNRSYETKSADRICQILKSRKTFNEKNSEEFSLKGFKGEFKFKQNKNNSQNFSLTLLFETKANRNPPLSRIICSNYCTNFKEKTKSV